MRFVQFDDFRLGVLNGEQITDVSDLVGRDGTRPQSQIENLIARWDELAPALREAASQPGTVALESVRLRAPVPRPGQLVCAAVNYIEKARPEPAPFNAFLKATTSIVGNGDTVELPDTDATVFHFEPELALVIGKPASYLKEAEAMGCIFGYTQFMDVSARGLPGGFFLGKSWHTFAPMGPVLVTADEVPAPNHLRVQVAVNGEVRQDFSTSEMARHIPQLLVEITKVMALAPGDVVATGTHHEGLSPIKKGDRVRLSVEGMGPALEVTVRDARNRTW